MIITDERATLGRTITWWPRPRRAHCRRCSDFGIRLQWLEWM